jgi:hypothetical protein
MVGYQYPERWYGPKYDASEGYLSAAEIAKRVRTEIKAQVKAGNLPAEATYSVTCENYSMGRSVNVEIRDLPDAWKVASFATFGVLPGDAVLTAKAEQVEKQVEAIRSAWNYDGSDIRTDYFDVNYYGSTKVESEWGKQFRLKEKARAAARKASRAKAS